MQNEKQFFGSTDYTKSHDSWLGLSEMFIDDWKASFNFFLAIFVTQFFSRLINFQLNSTIEHKLHKLHENHWSVKSTKRISSRTVTVWWKECILDFIIHQMRMSRQWNKLDNNLFEALANVSSDDYMWLAIFRWCSFRFSLTTAKRNKKFFYFRVSSSNRFTYFCCLGRMFSWFT